MLFIQRLAIRYITLGLGTMLIGDMGMPAGGRFKRRTRQPPDRTGCDIFLQLPKARWTSAQLLKPQALDLVASDGKRVVPSLWTRDVFQHDQAGGGR